MGYKAQGTRHKTKFRLLNYCLLPIAYCLLLLLSSCFKEKPIAAPSNQGRGQTAVIEMGPDYNDQFFYSLATNTVLAHNSRFAYDLMFDCDASKFHIWLNTAKFMSVRRMNQTNLDSVQLSDTLTLDWHYELGEFNPDSNAIGNWWNTLSSEPSTAGKVYLIQLGVDNEGNSFGFVKLQVNNFYGNSYSITYSDFVHPAQTILIAKDGNYNYRYLVLGTGALLNNIEPPKTEWDLCFTRYSVFFYAPYYIPYQVTGVLNNPSRTQAYLDSTIVFDSIKIGNFNESRLLTRRDAIGYEWKNVSGLTLGATYSIHQGYVYYVRSDNNKFYKLRFFDFYKGTVKGYPSFEYYEL